MTVEEIHYSRGALQNSLTDKVRYIIAFRSVLTYFCTLKKKTIMIKLNA